MDPFGRMRRNLTDALIDGATDGALKKAAPNWGNRVADQTDAARDLLADGEGGFDWSPSTGGLRDQRQYTEGYVRH